MSITSKKINLTQLDKELGGKGLIANFEDESAKIILPADNSDVTEQELDAAIAKHIAVTIEPTIEEKLASVNLSVADLKTALGL